MYIPFHDDQTFATQSPQTCSQHASPTSILGLPRLDKAVPVESITVDEPSIVNFARALAKADIITAEDRARNLGLHKTITDALTRTIVNAAGTTATFDLSVRFMTEAAGHFEIENDFYFEYEQSMILLVDCNSDLPWVRIEKAIVHLNSIHPDLGQTLYAVLERAGDASMQVHTFATVQRSFSYELGLEESEWIEEENEGSVEEVKSRMQTLLGHFPHAWIADAKPVLSPDALSQILATHALHPHVVEAINAALEIARYYKNGEYGLGSCYSLRPIYCLAVLLFEEHDPTAEIYDEAITSANECSDNYTRNLHEERFGLDDCDRAVKRIHDIVEGFRLLGAIDRLITALSLLNTGVIDA